MPGNGKYGTTYDKLPKKYPVMEKLFKTSPEYDGTYKHSDLLAVANKELVPQGVQKGDPLIFPGGVDFTYGGAPNLADVTTSNKQPNKGWPATPYTPNPVSPGQDPAAVGDNVVVNVDPLKIDDPNLTPADLKPNVVPGKTDNTQSPSSTSGDVAKEDTLGATLKLGRSSNTRWTGDPQ
jgi:hypothetical protein